MRVAVVAEFYPRAADPVLGVWAHRQAIAARDAGAEVRVLVLHRPLPAARRAARRAGERAARQRLRRRAAAARASSTASRSRTSRSSPRRARAPTATGAAGPPPPLAVALRALRRGFAVRRRPRPQRRPRRRGRPPRAPRAPLVVSVHGGDVFHTAPRSARGAEAVRAALHRAQLVLANSAGIEARCRALGARATRVVHLGTDLPAQRAEPVRRPDVVTTGAPRRPQAPRRRPARDRAPARPPSAPALPRHRRRPRARRAAARSPPSCGIADRVEFAGQLAPAEALRAHAARDAAGDAVDRRGVRRGLRRGDGRLAAGDRRARRARAGRDRGRRRRHDARRRPATSRSSPRRSTRCSRRARAPQTGGAARAPRCRTPSPGRTAARRRSPPTRRRCVTPSKPVLFVTNHVPPERVGAFAALHARVPLELAIFGGRSIHATEGVADPGVPAPPRAPARGPRARVEQALPRRRLRDRGADRAAGGRARGARRPHAVRPVERAVGAPAHPGARRGRRPAARRPVPDGRRRRRLRARTSRPSPPPAARATSTSHRRPSTTRSGAPTCPSSGRHRSPRCFSVGRVGQRVECCSSMPGVRRASEHRPPRSSSSVREPGPPGTPPAARWPLSARNRRSRSATSWPAPTFASYRLCAPAASASPGDSSPTKP